MPVNKQSSKLASRWRRFPWILAGDVFALLFLALLVRVLTFGRLHGQSPDEFFYLVLARDFLRVWMHQAPPVPMDTLHTAGFPLLLATIFFIRGEVSLEVGQGLGSALNALTVPAAYLLGRICLPRPVAFGAALILGTSPAFLRDADRVWIDHLGTFLATLYLILALMSWKTGKLVWWVGASAMLAMLAFAKEYLFVLFVPVTLIGALAALRRYSWRFWVASLGIASLFVGLMIWVQAGSGWLPKASYLEAILKGVSESRREYLGFSWVPNLRNLYYQNLYETELPAIFLVLGLAGVLRSILCWKRHPEDHIPAITLGAVFAVFAGYFSLFEYLYGARLLFPAFPAVALAAGAGLWPDGTWPPVILIAIAGGLTLMPPLKDWPPVALYPAGWACGMLFALAGLQALGNLCARREDVSVGRGLRLITFSLSVALCLGWSGIHLRRLAHVQEEAHRQIGAQSGFAEARQWIRQNIRPDDPILSANPRMLAYYTGSSSYRLASNAWWEQRFKQVQGPYLRKHRIRWIAITRPEFSERGAWQMYHYLKSRSYLEAAYTIKKEGSIALAFFRVRSQGKSSGKRSSQPNLSAQSADN